jgi:hypothetical protein
LICLRRLQEWSNAHHALHAHHALNDDSVSRRFAPRPSAPIKAMSGYYMRACGLHIDPCRTGLKARYDSKQSTYMMHAHVHRAKSMDPA